MKKFANLIFVLILLVQVIYSAIFIYQSSFVVDGQRYFVLFDDAMISMRFAQNLAQGEGLVWNAGGERVEGYTNLLWVVFMALFHLLPIPAPSMSLAVQVSGAVFYLGSLWVLKKIAESIFDDVVVSTVALVAVFLSAFYIQINVWNLLGMETSATILITNLAVLWSIRTLQTPPARRRSPLGLYLMLGVSTLLRLDMVVIGLAIVMFLAAAVGWDHWQGRAAGTQGLHPGWADVWAAGRELALGAAILGGFILVQTVWRGWYYGELLPNTYYLKVTGAPKSLVLIRGLFVYVKFLWNFNLMLFVLPFLAVALRRERVTLLLSWVFLAMSTYSIYVGGDAWESKGGANRFISTVLPLFFVLFAYGLEAIRRALVAWAGKKGMEAYSTAALWGFAILALMNFNAVLDTSSLKHAFLLERHPFVPGSERYVRIAQVLEKISTPTAQVAVVTAGIIPYYSQRPAIDLLGKIDKVIARQEMHIDAGLPLIDFRPGHMKWDSAYSLGQLQPDIVAQLYDGYDNPDNLQYLTNYTRVDIQGLPFFLRNDSPNVLWETVQTLSGK